MANGYIDKFKVGSTEYDIQAASGTDHAYYVDKTTTAVSANEAKTATVVGSAKGINSTYKLSLGGDISGDVLVGTAISANKTINTRITNTPWKAISGTDASGSKSPIAYNATTWSSTNERFLVPNVTKDYVDSQVSGIAESAGLYQAKGNSTFANLTNATAHHNGYVFNITDSGVIPTTSGYNGQTFEVQPGDNLVWIQDETKPGWDKLADPFAVAKSTLKPYSAASADMSHFNSTYSTITGTNGSAAWANSAHNVFSQVKTQAGNINAGAYNTTLHLSGINGVAAAGSSPTATFGFSGDALSAFKTIKVTNAAGTTANVAATTYADQLTLVAGTKITLNPTVDANGNPTITINKTDTTYVKATSSTLGMVQKSYYVEKDTTNHIGTLVVQGNMSSTTFNTP